MERFGTRVAETWLADDAYGFGRRMAHSHRSARGGRCRPTLVELLRRFEEALDLARTSSTRRQLDADREGECFHSPRVVVMMLVVGCCPNFGENW